MNKTLTAKLERVTFIQASTNAEKLQIVFNIVLEAHQKNKKCIIYTESFDAAKYIDNLLWKVPEDSFIPHSIADQETNERIVITTKTANFNEAEVAINLTSLALSNLESCILEIFELMDLTSQEKETLSKQKLASYTARNVPCLTS